VQEAEGEPSLEELQETLRVGSGDKTVNGSTAGGHKAPVKGLNATVFDDF